MQLFHYPWFFFTAVADDTIRVKLRHYEYFPYENVSDMLSNDFRQEGIEPKYSANGWPFHSTEIAHQS